MKTVISTNVPSDIAEQLKKNASARDLNMSEYLRQIIESHIQTTKPVIHEKTNNEDILTKLKKLFGETEIEKKPYRNKRHYDAKWVCPQTNAKLYKDVKLSYDNLYYKIQNKNGEYHWNKFSNIDLNKVLVLNEIKGDKDYFTVGEMKLGNRIIKISIESYKRLLYNILEGTFDEIISNFKIKAHSLKFSKKDNVLCINGVATDISIREASEMIAVMQNSNLHERTIFKLQHSYPQHLPFLIRCICDNYDNDALCNIVFEKKEHDFIENNTSKRKNLIMNNTYI